MVDQQIGLEEIDDGLWAIHLGTVLLATVDERNYIITEEVNASHQGVLTHRPVTTA